MAQKDSKADGNGGQAVGGGGGVLVDGSHVHHVAQAARGEGGGRGWEGVGEVEGKQASGQKQAGARATIESRVGKC